MADSRVALAETEARVLGAMVEKAMTTPDHYPMSLNAVATACSQVSNRDPVVDYSDAEVERILRALTDRGLAKMVHRPGDRVVKYRHALGEALDLEDRPLALLAVLLLRGAQTPGEMRQRTVRYVEFESLAGVEEALEELRDGGVVARLDREPGQKEHRYVELLSPRAVGMERTPGPDVDEPAAQPHESPRADDDLRVTVAELQDQVAALRRRLAGLLEQLGVDDI